MRYRSCLAFLGLLKSSPACMYMHKARTYFRIDLPALLKFPLLYYFVARRLLASTPVLHASRSTAQQLRCRHIPPARVITRHDRRLPFGLTLPKLGMNRREAPSRAGTADVRTPCVVRLRADLNAPCFC